MVQVLERPPSFGEMMGRGLGQGLSHGITQGVDFAKQLGVEKYKRLQREKLIQGIEGSGTQHPIQDLEKEFTEALPQIEQQLGRELQPQEREQLWEQAQQLRGSEQQTDPFAKAKRYAAAGEHELASIEKERAKIEEEKRELPKKEFIKQAAKDTSEYVKTVRSAEESLPIEDISLQMMEEAVEDPSKWAAVGEFLADKTGFEGFRTARGAELKSAVKQHFLGDLSSIKGGRPNILLEKNLLESYPMLGRDPIASQKFLAGAKMAQEIKHAKVEIARELQEKYLDKMGYLPANFESEVRKRLKPIALKAESQATKKIAALSKYQNEYRKLADKNLQKGEILMMTPEGEYVGVKKSELDSAREQGYIKLKG